VYLTIRRIFFALAMKVAFMKLCGE